MKQNVTRLYDSFKPTNYALGLSLDPKGMKFAGSVIITGNKTGRPSQRLILHQKDLKVTAAKITRSDKKGSEEMTVDRINTHGSYDELRLHSKSMLYPGAYTISVEFEGKITDQMNGLYPCYFEVNNKKQYLLATQFESHHAREVFPCIDEPEAKATFDLTLITPDDGLTVLANTPIKKQLKVESKKLKVSKPSTLNPQLSTTFETTPVMSTYLLAFVYGNVGYKEAKTARGTLVRTYATPDNVAITGFALETAVRCLEFYEEYFGIPYPLEKCDLIGLPDFASGAMENWGLITYREQCLFVDPKNTSLGTKQYVAMVVAHELAHQWFGNLVTMEWWTDLWLNEGFASWIEYLAVDALFPDWEMWTQFIVDEQQQALKLDALDNTHPVEVTIKHPDEIRSIFDAISYNKGASVIHMLHGYLGADLFRDGLRHYLSKHAYKNTVTTDLWTALEEKSGKPVKKFMHAWTSQPGFPIVSFTQKSDKTTLTQERFYLNKPDHTETTHWPIPVIGPDNSPDSFNTKEAEYNSDYPTKINHHQSGFYRTVYDAGSIAAFASVAINYSALDRLGLLADSFEAAKAGYTPLSSALQLLAAYGGEDNAAVWDIIAINLGEIRRIMDDDSVREAIKPFIIRLSAKELARLGWNNKPDESHFDKLLRPTIIGMNAGADEQITLNEALTRFDAMKKPEDIPADLRGIVYTAAARNGDRKTFDKLLELHNKSSSSEERTTLAVALTSFKQPELIKRALATITTGAVRHQDVMYWVAYSFGNHHAKHATWLWLKEKWNWLEESLGSDLSFYRTPIYVGRSFSDPEFKKEYEMFFKHKKTPSLERSIKQGAEMLAWQIDWKQRELAAVQKFLSSP